MKPVLALRTLALAVLASASLTGVAFARDQVFSVRLAGPAQETRVIAENAVWTCEGDSCVARVSHSATVRACRQFVREAGVAVTAYGPEGDQLTAEELARCNGQDAPQVQQADAQ